MDIFTARLLVLVIAVSCESFKLYGFQHFSFLCSKKMYFGGYFKVLGAGCLDDHGIQKFQKSCEGKILVKDIL